MIDDKIKGPSFREGACARFCWPPGEFESQALRKTLYPLANFLYPLICFFSPRYFQAELGLLRDVASISDLDQLKAEYRAWRGRQIYHRGLGRKLLRLRMSGQKLLALGREAFGPD